MLEANQANCIELDITISDQDWEKIESSIGTIQFSGETHVRTKPMKGESILVEFEQEGKGKGRKKYQATGEVLEVLHETLDTIDPMYRNPKIYVLIKIRRFWPYKIDCFPFLPQEGEVSI